MITLSEVELGVLGPLQVRQYGLPVSIPGAKPRAILTMLGLHGGSVVPAGALVELLWGDDPPRTATKALQTHISSLRRTLGDGFVLTEGTGWVLSTIEVDAVQYNAAAKLGRKALAAGDPGRAVALFDQALALWRGIPELPDGPRGSSEKTRWIEGHAALVEDRADALLASGRAAEIVGELESAIAEAPLRERRWGHLMLALYRAGRQGEALGAYKRARSLLAEELGVDPGPDLRRLEAAIVAQDATLEVPQSQQLSAVTRAVTFLLTDIEGSTAAWEADADAMATALARHDEIVEQVVTSRGGRLIKTRGEGDATFSVFDRPSAAAAAAIELQDAICQEGWRLADPMRIRVALHTGEVEFRDGDYFGRAVNRAARLRSLAAGGQILCSGATAELVIDSLPDDVVLADLGTRRLRNLPRPEHVFELRMETADDTSSPTAEAPIQRPPLPAVLVSPGPFVGRSREVERLVSAWQSTLAAGTRAILIAGEPGVGKTRLAGEWSRQAYEQGAVVLYGRCDEDLGAPYQPFAEALRSLVPCVGSARLRSLRGVEALLPLVPGLTDALPDLEAPPHADPDTERYALFDAVVALLGVASATAPVVLILDDLHWAAKPTLLMLRHLLRFGDEAQVQIVGTYRSTDLDRSHPLAAMLADLHRDGTANRLALSGLDQADVTAYVAEAGYDDEELGRALAAVTGGNPFFLIEALRHVDESGGHWDPSTLPQGVREAVSRRLSRLTTETNKALAAAAVVGSRFALTLVEQVLDDDLVDAFDEACKAGIVIEESGGWYRFNHALIRQSLLAELPSVRRMRLHQRIAGTLESQPGADDELLSELAYHYFECAWAGNAAKAVEYCRRAADQAMARVAYEAAADLYDRALHALEELDDELPDRDDLQAELLIAHCESLLAAGDVVSAKEAVSQLRDVAGDSGRLAAWGVCFDGELSMLTAPERLDEIESAVNAAAEQLAGFDDAAGEAKAHTVRAGCLARIGRIGDCETALDQALTAARRAHEHRRVNAVLANAPLAALWGPNPVPRAGGRCLDVVRLLRITTGSPLVEATSTRCQAVLDALRGRAAEGRRLIESARRTLTELGQRHALLEVDQFAGIIELVADDPAAAEPYLRRAYEGFRRMGLDTDTADTAALLARACLALDRDADADELCTASECLAGHGSKASIAWRAVRAQLLARSGAHDRARQVAEEAVGLAASTDALVDHGDACLALATVLRIAGDSAGARAAAEHALDLYDRKGAAALAEKARSVLGKQGLPAIPPAFAPPPIELETACVRAIDQLIASVEREAWDEVEQLLAPEVLIEDHRKIVGFERIEVRSTEWPHQMKRFLQIGMVRYRHSVVAVRGERLALTRLEGGTSDASPGAPKDEMLRLIGLDEEGRIGLDVRFDVNDMDAAVAELDATYSRLEQQRRTPLENAASRADARFNALFADRRWNEIGALFTDDLRVEDRRRGLRREGNGRASELAEVRAIAELGTANMTSEVIAIRGDHLALLRTVYSGRDARPEAFHTVLLRVAEIDPDERIAAFIAFDSDDLESALKALDTRYIAGLPASHARTWSVIAEGYATLNRKELAATTPDWVNIDRRRFAPIAAGRLGAYIRASQIATPNIDIHAEAVHRLTELGVVVTRAVSGTFQEGFYAEWREIDLLTVEGILISRCEIFDEADLGIALTEFDELNRPVPQLVNTASRMHERMQEYFANHDWDAARELMTDGVSIDDRRRVVNTEVRQGRDATIARLQAGAELGATTIASVVLATRGDRLALLRTRYSGMDPKPEAFHTEDLTLVEIDADGRIRAGVIFDLDDFDSAIADLDARYLAGEAAPHAQAWAVVAGVFASLARHEVPSSTPKWLNIDHRRGTPLANADLRAVVAHLWDVTPDLHNHIETVHRLSDYGALVTQVSSGTTDEGFPAEWRMLNLLTVEGQLVNGCELFDEDDLDSALARFDELDRPATPHIENTASRAIERFQTCFAARDWTGMARILAPDVEAVDRRPVMVAGTRDGQDINIDDWRSVADVGFTNISSTVIATRGERLMLGRFLISTDDRLRDAYHNDVLGIIELNADNRIAACVMFDLSDPDAAFEELETRYLAGEASGYAQTWSAIAESFKTANEHELPKVAQDWVSIDHRRGAIAFAPGEMLSYTRAIWDDSPDFKVYIESIHRLDRLGAVVTYVGNGSSRQGFEAEWREVAVSTVDGDLINRCELYELADLDTALVHFAELNRPTPRLNNGATEIIERIRKWFVARRWDAIGESLAANCLVDDRRRTVNGGIRLGPEVALNDLQMAADVGFTRVTEDVVAIRGDRLALTRACYTRDDQRKDGFYAEVLHILESDGEKRIAATIVFDPDDIDAAFAELDARYLVGEAAPYARTWSVISQITEQFNRREVPGATANAVSIDHRRGTAFAPGELSAYLRATWDQSPRARMRIEAAHRLSDSGALIGIAADAISVHGFDAEWKVHELLILEGDLVSRCEIFDEADLEAALARFDEFNRPAPQLENAASRVFDRTLTRFTARDWDAMGETLAQDYCVDDRRRTVNAGIRHGRDTELEDARASADVVGITDATSVIIAIRGDRLALSHTCYRAGNKHPEITEYEVLQVIEIDDRERMTTLVVFDLDTVDTALAELDSRYLAGEAAPYAANWSVITKAYASFNRHEPLPTTWISVDHRRGTPFTSSDLIEFVSTSGDLAPNLRNHIEAVHRLGSVGAVLTNASHDTTSEGFLAEWRAINLVTVDGDRINRCEIYDESDLDAAIAEFERLARPAPRLLQNAASRAHDQFTACFTAGDWDALAENMADGSVADDRRRLLGTGRQDGRNAVVREARAVVGLGVTSAESEVIATRGDRLVLMRARFSGRDRRPDAFHAEVLHVVEVDTDHQITAFVGFDLDDLDAAFAELDARYLAGEAAPHAQAWSVIAGNVAAFNEHELPAWTRDHRKVTAVAPGDHSEYVRAAWNQMPDIRLYIETVHRLSDVGAVVAHRTTGTSREGFEAEWRGITVSTVEGDRIDRSELFDEADLDAALARFDELSQPAKHLGNAASCAYERFNAYLADPDWDAMSEMIADDAYSEDRRRLVRSGIQRGRDAQLAHLRAVVGVGVRHNVSSTIATRGERLALVRTRVSGGDQRPEAFGLEMLHVIEIDADCRISAGVTFDLDDFDGAIAEIDARYAAGEAARHAHTWSVIAQGYAAANRGELAATSPNVVNIDHRRLPMIKSGELIPYLRNTFDDLTNIRTYVEAVHRLTDAGAVVTHVGYGTSREGFDAEWRMINVLVANGDVISRSETYDEADLDAALLKFEELSRSATQLDNDATRVDARFWRHFAIRDWDAVAELIADNICVDDRRRVVNAGVRHGRAAHIADVQAVAGVGAENTTSTVVATRGGRLALTRVRSSMRGLQPGESSAEVLSLVEVDVNNRIVARIGFDLDDIDAAFEELDARYLAGEAAQYARTWTTIMGTFAAANRRELAEFTPDWVTIDHRRAVAFAPGELASYAYAARDDMAHAKVYVEAVHRLNSLGAVVTCVAHGTSTEGFAGEWRGVSLSTVEGGRVNRSELFDEADLDAALACLEELSQPVRRLENAASRVAERFCECFGTRDWRGMGDTLADDVFTDDNRPVVGVGKRRGRDLNVADWQAVADVGTKNLASAVIATRGDRLVLSRFVTSGRDQRPEAFRTEVLCVIETNADNRIVACVMFEPDEIDAAYKELDGRYLASEAARYADVWSVFADTYAMFNKHEIPPLANWVTIDHRVRQSFAAEDLAAYIRSGWDVTPENKMYVECVHRLSELGAVVTHVAYGTSPEGFYAEWRMIALVTLGGTSTNRCELFDEAEIETALAKFDELSRPTPRLENTATRVYDRLLEHHAARDYDASAEMLAEDYCLDDRRRVVNAGIRHGRDAAIADARTVTELGGTHITSDVIAARGEQLFLARSRVSIHDKGPEVFDNESFVIVEIGADERVVAMVVFDLNDIDAAFAELDARYLAGEAAAHARTWSVVTDMHEALNRHAPPLQAPNCVRIDHRRPATFEMNDLAAFCDATWDLTPEATVYVEAVHRLTDLGAVFTQVTHGTSQEGFDVEWRMIDVLTVDGDLTNRGEIFEETDLDAALARFDELERPAPRLENDATRMWARLAAVFNHHDVEGFRVLTTPNGRLEDRRKGLRALHTQPERRRAIDALFEAPPSWRLKVENVATRGSRLSLARQIYRDSDDNAQSITVELLAVVELSDDGLMDDFVNFDPDDIDAAFEELESRYLAGEAAVYAHTWSVITEACAAFNRREIPAATPDWVDHRLLATIHPGDLFANVQAAYDLVPDVKVHITSVHRLNELGAIVDLVVKGSSQEGYYAEYHEIAVVTVAGDLPKRFEMFDEADFDAALARFDELSRSTHSIENAATRTWARLVDAYNRRNLDAFVALTAPDGQYHDRRKGLRDKHDGSMRWRVAQTLFDFPPSFRLETQPLAIRGSRLCLLRQALRDTDDAERSIVIELLTVLEATEEGLAHTIVNFDTDDIDSAMAELTARWIASGEVSHPEVIEVARINAEAANRHDWDALVNRHAGATYVNHRQLASGADTVADDMSSLRVLASLVPDLSFEAAEILTHSASGFVTHTVAKGTSTDGVAIEIPLVVLMLVEGDRITHAETFDLDQRDLALTRFEELNASG